MSLLAKNWWALVLRGVVAILLGCLAFALPGITLAVLVLMFGAYALVDGIFNIIAAVRAAENREHWGWLLFAGFTGIAAAAVTAFWPGITLLALVFVIGAWAIVTGAMELASAIRLRREVRGEWLLALSGIAAVIFGTLVILMPAAGALVLALWLAAFLLVIGVLLVTLGVRLHALTGGEAPGGPRIHPVVPRPVHH